MSAGDTRLNDWYKSLASRRVDLVGDYAGTELFLIEGDSLLLHAFSDPQLDFSGLGFQLLHAVYTAERFLRQLIDRKCQFEIVFFDDHEQLSIPEGTGSDEAHKFLLARAAIIRHLQRNLSGTVNVRSHSSITDPAFLQYLYDAGIYFVMAHDGAACEDETREAFRYALRWWVSHGWNVALLNTVELHDTRAMAVVVEGRKHELDIAKPTISRDLVAASPLDLTAVDIGSIRKQIESQNLRPSEREVLSILALVALVKGKALTPENITTYVLHLAALKHVPLAERRVDPTDASVDQSTDTDGKALHELRKAFSESVLQILRDPDLIASVDAAELPCDLADLIDGRLLALVNEAEQHTPLSLSEDAIAYLEALRLIIMDIAQVDLPKAPFDRVKVSGIEDKRTSSGADEGSLDASFPVLPFEHPVFESHLAPVRLSIDPSTELAHSYTETRIFQELSHWHNASRPLVVKGNQVQVPDWKARRRNDRFMDEMLKYSASLTNAAGNVLDPETIVTRLPSIAPAPAKKQPQHAPAKTSGGKVKSGTGGKKVGGRAAALEAAAKVKATKAETKDAQYTSSWDAAYKDISKLTGAEARFLKADKYLNGLSKAARGSVEAEIELYKALCLFELYQNSTAALSQKTSSSSAPSKAVQSASTEGHVAVIWAIALKLRAMNAGLPKNVTSTLNEMLKSLSLPPIVNPSAASAERKLPFKLPEPGKISKSKSLTASRDPQRFQLEHCGPYFERSFDASPDSRVVGFEPDKWQRQVLDTIDARKSLLVLAPTSAGKTFISFYAMKQVLEQSDDGVLVYIAPTKALVNQIAAEIQARFSKTFKHGGQSVWGIHTRDYRINNPTGCQVLVTVPQILQIMLLAPSNAEKKNSWSNRVRHIIFDEVHSIGQAEDGLIWEQLLLLAPCPIIALSATVGNPQALGSWLEATQRALGNDFVTVQHKTRYSDLRKFNYHPPKEFKFEPLEKLSTINIPGLDGSDAFAFIHPVSSLVDRSRGIPQDLSLEARDCLTLYEALAAHQSEKYPLSSKLAPSKVLPDIIRKADILKWEQALKDVLREWMRHEDSPFNAVLQDLGHDGAPPEGRAEAGGSNAQLTETTLPLLVDLHKKNALPAILFNFDRSQCEDIANDILTKLKQNEDEWKAGNAAWKKKYAAWQEWKDTQEKAADKAKKGPAKEKKKKKGNDDEDGGVDPGDNMRDAGQQSSSMASFDPDAPIIGFHFANWKVLLPSEFEEYRETLTWRGVTPWLIEALARGIGVHHAGMNRKYRQAVEILFRKGFLRVIVATGTLALGINMPCKTVVFSGDSVFLTALNFRQSAGRAGRRGFDVLGNVVFQNIPSDKVYRLLSSRLPDLNGHFPITTSLVLRLFTLLHETKNSEYASRAVNALLSQPRLYLGGEEAKMTVLHHLRFSIDYLRRTALLGRDGEPLNLAGLVSHLYYTENSGFAFHALLKGGYFHNLCAGIATNPKRVLLELMLTMSHLFNRIPCKRSDEEFLEEVVKRSSSKVLLDPMPTSAVNILAQHNEDTLKIYRTYVATFIGHYVKEPDHRLPLSNLAIGPMGAQGGARLHGAQPPVRIRSPFVALSGHGDDFTTIHDLCSTVRSGVFLEENVIPYVALYPQESDVPLNAYLLDFFKHGSIRDLEEANGIRKGNIWFVLNDFSMVLATIVASLENFMKLTPVDADDLDIRGSGDAAEEMAGDTKTDDSGYVTAENSVGDESDDGLSESLASASLEEGRGLLKVLKAMKMLQAEFNTKFKRTWA